MNFNKDFLIGFVLTLYLPSLGYGQGNSVTSQKEIDYRNSVVPIRSWKRAIDVSNPWQKKKLTPEQHLGVLVDEQHLLTTAFAVMDSNWTEMMHWGESKPYSLAIDCVDFEANLALLHAIDSSALTGFKPLDVESSIDLNQSASIVKPYDQFTIKLEQARFVKVDANRSATSAYQMMKYLFEVQHEGFGWSEPVVLNHQLLAIVSHRESQGIVHTIPGAILQHFFTDCRSATIKEKEGAPMRLSHSEPYPLPVFYRGFPTLGLTADFLTSPKLREWLGVSAKQGGILIEKVYEDSPFFGKLFPNDILWKVNDIPIDEYGNYLHPRWGQVPIQVVINQLYAGDETTLEIIRKGEFFTLKGNLRRHDSNHFLVPWYRNDAKEPYVIFGGLVFQELSVPYLKEWGTNWLKNAPLRLLYPFLYLNDSTLSGQKRMIILSQVLADKFNHGYQDLPDGILEKVNGHTIESLEDLREALLHPVENAARKRFAVFTFRLDGGEVILSYDDLEKAHRRIAKAYKIPETTSFFAFP